jgi:hypothetical protein
MDWMPNIFRRRNLYSDLAEKLAIPLLHTPVSRSR